MVLLKIVHLNKLLHGPMRLQKLLNILFRVVKPLEQLWHLNSCLLVILKIKIADCSFLAKFRLNCDLFNFAFSFNKFAKDLLSELFGVIIILHFNLQKLSVHMKKVNLKVLKRFEIYFALALHIQHREAYLVLFQLAPMVDHICIVDIVDTPYESLLRQGLRTHTRPQ